MQKVIWDIRYLSPPPAIKHCKKCGEKKEHYSSGLFRVNAQRKHLDIWLIYKCSTCDTTWNMTIYSRITPKSIAPELLEGFHSNSFELAEKYAMDVELMQRNGVEVGVPKYIIGGDMLDLSVPTELKIISAYPSRLKVESLIREKMGLSNSSFEKLVASGRIREFNDQDIRKCKVNREINLWIYPELTVDQEDSTAIV